MPYRRLPNTDSSRLKSLKTALKRGGNIPPKEKPFSQSSLQNIMSALPKFEMLIKFQKEAYIAQTEKSPEYNYLYKKARNYVSHFIQVLNLAIIRGDLKKEARDFFALDKDEKKLPTFKTEQDLIKWGDIILEGEQQRIGNGGNPMTNPTIGVVKVHYEKFIDAYRFQKNLQENYHRASQQVANFRPAIDKIILQLWNEIEATYESNDEVVRRNICREFGLVYFFRRNETIPVNENVSLDYRKKRVVNKDIVKNIVEENIEKEPSSTEEVSVVSLRKTKLIDKKSDAEEIKVLDPETTESNPKNKKEQESNYNNSEDDTAANFQYSLF